MRLYGFDLDVLRPLAEQFGPQSNRSPFCHTG